MEKDSQRREKSLSRDTGCRDTEESKRKEKEREGKMKMLLTNNSRRWAKKPLHRKGRGKRYKTRCEAWESICAFLEYCDE